MFILFCPQTLKMGTSCLLVGYFVLSHLWITVIGSLYYNIIILANIYIYLITYRIHLTGLHYSELPL